MENAGVEVGAEVEVLLLGTEPMGGGEVPVSGTSSAGGSGGRGPGGGGSGHSGMDVADEPPLERAAGVYEKRHRKFYGDRGRRRGKVLSVKMEAQWLAGVELLAAQPVVDLSSALVPVDEVTVGTEEQERRVVTRKLIGESQARVARFDTWRAPADRGLR